jgi:hypothetical protein
MCKSLICIGFGSSAVGTPLAGDLALEDSWSQILPHWTLD